MLWEIEIHPLTGDREAQRVNAQFALLTAGASAGVTATATGYLLAGPLTAPHLERLLGELLLDPLVETALVRAPRAHKQPHIDLPYLQPPPEVLPPLLATVLLKPGVMDPTAQSVLDTAQALEVPLTAVRRFRRYFAADELSPAQRELLFRRVLANEAIEQVVTANLTDTHLALGTPYTLRLVHVPLAAHDDAGLEELSRAGQLALNVAEMRAVQAHFRALGRVPTDIELETIAQTWSEHCSHKTLKGPIDFLDRTQGSPTPRRIPNLLKSTIFAATQTLRDRWGADDWCVSVFADNAGVVRFDDEFHVCIKVETHNHPSAIEPYGGANTGLGGVIRDPLGTGLGAKPIANSDVFCFAAPNYPADQLPAGVLHPRQVMQGVVAGVRDYGNRMGIPTVNGAVIFDNRYLGNPLVYCGTVGLIPVDKVEKRARPGDKIVALGGRTGRDGIHGATFSSLELTSASESVSGGAVQIGNAITEKKLLDVLLVARDRGLFSAVTDCGAGGFSSAIGEMAADLGATVQLDRAPLKYAGLSYTEIWISEAQERMVLAVPPAHWHALATLCAQEDVEVAELGTFDDSGRLRLFYGETLVGDLDLHFLHEGRPAVVRQAVWNPPTLPTPSADVPTDWNAVLLAILSSYSVCSKEAIIRQYDHEVQGGSVLKPLVGLANDGPGDAAVLRPVQARSAGLALGCGLNPRYGDLDPYAMAAAAIDEAVRNVVAVGADPARVAILDNFCWGNVTDPVQLGALVRTAQACHDVALAYGTPFVSGKDSLNNEFRTATGRISIPGTLLITALGRVNDVTRCVSMDLKAPGNHLFLVGTTHEELGGSHYHLVRGQTGGTPPQPNLDLAPRLFAAVHRAIAAGQVRACHDLSEGGLAVALAEMAFAGGVGADVTGVPTGLSDVAWLFSESCTRWVLEVPPPQVAAVQANFAGLPFAAIGQTVKEQRLRIAGTAGEWLIWAKLADLKEAWQRPLRGV
jgi:phosphoribosylformylglycinamidine synthase